MTGPQVKIREKATGKVYLASLIDGREAVQHPDATYEYAPEGAEVTASGPTPVPKSAEAAASEDHAAQVAAEASAREARIQAAHDAEVADLQARLEAAVAQAASYEARIAELEAEIAAKA